MSVTTRPAIPSDADAMCAVLNPIIYEGSTTGHRNPFDASRMDDHYIAPQNNICATVVELEGEMVGFQSLVWSDPNWQGPGYLPDRWGVIATFVRPGLQGRGIGQALWRATKDAATKAHVIAVDATIRTDNVPGLAYYSGLGFRDYSTLKDFKLSDGTLVEKTRKRFDISQN